MLFPVFLENVDVYIQCMYICIHTTRNTWLQVIALIPYTSFQNDDDVAVPCRHDAMATLSELWRLEDAPGRIQVHPMSFSNRKKVPPLTTKMEPMKIEIWKVLFLF